MEPYDKEMEIEEYLEYMRGHFPDDAWMYQKDQAKGYYSVIQNSGRDYYICSGRLIKHRPPTYEQIKVVRGGVWHVWNIMG